MEEPQSPKLDSPLRRKRKVPEKKVVTVKIENSGSTGKCEGPPSDLWSWRKYGQKPIKGSPFPRGYYRCSTSKGCSAKKQVERCKTDPSILIITYTSDHNHSDPLTIPLSSTEEDPEDHTITEEDNKEEKEEREVKVAPEIERESLEDNDFFDELEELPIISLSASHEERIVLPLPISLLHDH